MGAGQRKGEGGDPGDQREPYLPEFLPQAEEDLIAAIAQYELAEEGLGQRFHDAVRDMVKRILENPFLYPPASARHRKAVLTSFPFSIYYCVLKRKRIVAFVSIHHAKRHPKHWRRRKPEWRH